MTIPENPAKDLRFPIYLDDIYCTMGETVQEQFTTQRVIKMARKKSIKGCISESAKSQLGWAKYYREKAKAIRELGKMLPIGLPSKGLDIEEYTLTYRPENTTEANSIRAEVGKVLAVKSWEKCVNSYNGTVSYRANYKLPNGRTINIAINNGELAPGCQVVQVEEMRKVWKSVCPETVQQKLTS